MTWRIHPAKDNRRKLVLALVIIIPVLGWLWFSAGPFWAIFGLFLIFASLLSFFLPTEYSIDEKGIRIKKFIYTHYRPVNEFKKIYILENGILFSPFKKKTFLNNFRGLFLLFPRDRDSVISYVNSMFHNLISEGDADDKP